MTTRAQRMQADRNFIERELTAERDTLRAQLAQVEGERDEAREDRDTAMALSLERADNVQRLTAENARLREALRLAAVELEHGRTRAVRGDIERDGHTVSERNGYMADSARRVEKALRAALEEKP